MALFLFILLIDAYRIYPKVCADQICVVACNGDECFMKVSCDFELLTIHSGWQGICWISPAVGKSSVFDLTLEIRHIVDEFEAWFVT